LIFVAAVVAIESVAVAIVAVAIIAVAVVAIVAADVAVYPSARSAALFPSSISPFYYSSSSCFVHTFFFFFLFPFFLFLLFLISLDFYPSVPFILYIYLCLKKGTFIM